MNLYARIRALRLAIALLCVALGCSHPPPIDYSGPTADWPHYGAELDGKRYSSLSQLKPDNVEYLEQVWRYDSGDLSKGSADTTRTSLQVTPIVVGQSLYFCTPFNRVVSLNAETGAENWTFDPGLKLRKLHGAYPLTCRGVSYWTGGGGVDACGSRVFTGTQDAELIALDAETGHPCEGFGDGGRLRLRDDLPDAPAWEYYVTSAPLVVGDLVVVGALVADNVRANAPPGVVRAFDARSGALVWAWDPIPPGGALPGEGEGPYRRSTANVWSTMSADPERNLVFVPTGNAPPDYYGGERNGLDYYSSSVVAIHSAGPEAGRTAWRFQTVHHDLWDYDIGAQPTLFDFEGPSGRVPAVIVSTKMGHVFVLDRVTGQPLLPVEERSVPGNPAPGESLSPTQPFPVKPPSLYPPELTAENAWGVTFWDRGKCADRIRELRADGLFTPPTVGGAVHYPGALGGINWGSGALDPASGVFVVNQSRVPTVATLIPRAEFDALPDDQTGDAPGGLPVSRSNRNTCPVLLPTATAGPVRPGYSNAGDATS